MNYKYTVNDKKTNKSKTRYLTTSLTDKRTLDIRWTSKGYILFLQSTLWDVTLSTTGISVTHPDRVDMHIIPTFTPGLTSGISAITIVESAIHYRRVW